MTPEGKKNPVEQVIRRAWSTIGILGVLVGAGSWHWFLFSPVGANLNELWGQVEKAYDYVATERAVQRAHREAFAITQGITARRDNQEGLTGTAPDEVAFLSWLSRESERLGLAINDFQPAGEVAGADYYRRTVQCSGTGRYDLICKLLDSLRRGQLMVRVAALELTPMDTERFEFTFTMRIELVTLKTPASTNL